MGDITITIQARVDPDLSAWVDRFAAAHGWSRSEVLTDALWRVRLEDELGDDGCAPVPILEHPFGKRSSGLSRAQFEAERPGSAGSGRNKRRAARRARKSGRK